MDVSTRRAKNGIAANVNGTQAAVVPMDVPTTIRVNGMMATIKMINMSLRGNHQYNAERNTNNHGHNRRDNGHLQCIQGTGYQQFNYLL